MGERGVELSKEKLRTLAGLIQRQEEDRIKSIRFNSERDRSDYLRCSRETHDKAVALLDDKGVTTKAATNDVSVEEVVQKYLSYLEMAVGFGMQTVANVHLRHDFLTKVRGHADSLIPRLNELRHASLEPWEIELKAKDLIEELSVFKEAMYKSIIKKADPSSRSFSKVVKLSGYSFEDLVVKYQKKLVREKGFEFDKPFEQLEDEQKIEVYDEIIKSSGRGTFLENTAYRVANTIGKGLLIFTLAMSVWDIYSSEHKLQTIVTEGAEFGAGWVGGYIGEIAGAAAATYLVTAVGVAATAVTAAFVGLAAFVTGIGIGIALGFLAGYIVGKIFESGGKHTGGAVKVKDSDPKMALLPNHPVYAAPMPDGALLARQLAYKGAPTTLVAVA
ncbi:uncharacterized protein LOC141619341 [Silene latifolia]|uniref:uncharacterized protein LOC141619341 n=1 Tax=Silene latifolia TaxID=37657 RepID=UPI003D770D5D